MKNRIIGFDIARAYAIFGMFIVNFNTVFGSHKNTSFLGRFLTLFDGNSSTTFVILAGMGVALMTSRAPYSPDEKQRLIAIIRKRSWFLFGIGLLLYTWWPADILHVYGGYMHIAALLLFVPKRYYLYGVGLAVLIFHLLFVFVSYDTGWNFNTLQYSGFWTISGFLRNTFYNGWNPIFPWISFFMLGMWLGRLNWQRATTIQHVFIVGLILFAITKAVQLTATTIFSDKTTVFYLTANYLPPFLPFMVKTSGFALMLIATCMQLGQRFPESRLLQTLAQTGQMTLTHYVVHLTLGMLLFAQLMGKTYESKLSDAVPTPPIYILAFACEFYSLSSWFSSYWSKRFGKGPLETLMRRVTG